MKTKGQLDETKNNAFDESPSYLAYKLYTPTLKPRSTHTWRVNISDLPCFNMDIVLPVDTSALPVGVTMKARRPSFGIVSFVFNNYNDREIKPRILKVEYIARDAKNVKQAKERSRLHQG